MNLNHHKTIDGNRNKDVNMFYIYLYKCVWVSLANLVANPLANEVCTQIAPRWLPLGLYKNRIQSNNNQA